MGSGRGKARRAQVFVATAVEESVCITSDNGDKEWWLEGFLHRVDGPAVEWLNGSQEWWLDGQRHRADGPAFVRAGGDHRKEWWIRGKLHRENGPAVEDENGYKEWWLNGEEVSEKDVKAAFQDLNWREAKVEEGNI